MSSTNKDKWKHLIFVSDEKASVRYVADIVKNINSQLTRGMFKELSDEMIEVSKLNLREVSVPCIVAVLRSTYAFRSKIPGWFDLILSVEDSFLEVNKNPDKLLRGLLNP